jgi:O-antigen ligase
MPRPGTAPKPLFQVPNPSGPARGQLAPASAKQAAAAGGFVMALFGFYAFMHTGAFGEIMAVYLHLNVPMVAAMAVIVSIAALFHGGLGRFGAAPTAKPWIILSVWLFITSIFSFSARESVRYIVPFLVRFMAMPLLFCAFATTTRTVQKLISWAAAGLIPVLVLCVTKGSMMDGVRFGVVGTSLENPNDLAFHLLWGSTLLLIFFFRGKLGKLLVLATVPPCFWFIMKTASRANLISIFVLVAVVFLIVPSSVRLVMAVVVPVVLVVTIAALPKATQQRILAIAISSEVDVAAQSNGTEDDNLKGALGSQAERMELSKLAIEATFRHPIFGTGPTMYANETAAYIMAKFGKKAPWLTAHDSYLKISSETGIPGLVFYVWAILSGLRLGYKTYMRTAGKPGMQIANRNALCLLLALVTYAFGTFFCDIVYYSYLPMTLGLTAANYLATINEERELEQSRSYAAVPA